MAYAPALPRHARVVVVGGGIIGTSTAYHLAQLGWTDIVLLERHQLTSGTTWHAAGLMVTYGSTSETSTELRKYTRDLYGRLEAETGQATGFMPIGFIEVAADKDRLEESRVKLGITRLETLGAVYDTLRGEHVSILSLNSQRLGKARYEVELRLQLPTRLRLPDIELRLASLDDVEVLESSEASY